MTLEQGVLIGQESGVLMALCCRILIIPVYSAVECNRVQLQNIFVVPLHREIKTLSNFLN